MNRTVFFVVFFVVLYLAACAGVDRVTTVNTVTDQSVLQLEKSISPFSVFVNGATNAGKALKYQAGKVDYLSKTVPFSKKIDFASSMKITLKDAHIIITATTNDSATTKKAIDDFKAELVKQFPK